MHAGYDWPPKAIELLKEMYARGVPLKEIASSLGVSEPSVHGKLDKLRMAGQRPEKERHMPLPRMAPPPEPPPPPRRPPPPAPREGLRTVMQVAPGECRWPYGDPKADDFRFCGRPVDYPGSPYCEAHGHKAYGTWPPRKGLTASTEREAA